MKLKTLMAAFLAVFALSACDKDDKTYNPELPEGETKSVYLKFNTGSSSSARSIEDPAGGKKAVLASAIIYFYGDNGNVYAVKQVGKDALDGSIEDVEKGKEFDKIPKAANKVYVVGNYNSADASNNSANFPVNAGGNISGVKNTSLDIEQMNFNKLADGAVNEKGLFTILDGEANVVAYSEQPNGWTNSTTQPGADDYYASVTISPISARIEINKLVYTGNLKSFEVEGIYVNNYYQNMPLNLNANGLSIIDNGSNVDNYDPADINSSYNKHTTMYDTLEENADIKNEKATFAPAAGTWAYQVFGENEVSHIVIKFTNVVTVNDENLGDRYITVKGFATTDDQKLSKFNRATVYQVKELAFKDSDLQVIPEPDLVSIWVEVNIQPWNNIEVKPIL